MTEDRRVEAIVRGSVQGVGFRFHVLRTASGLGLRGWVANEPDGTVRCVAEGPPAALHRLLAALRGGPPGAAVSEVDESWSAATGEFSDFGVHSGWHPGD